MSLPGADIPKLPDPTDPGSMMEWVRAIHRATMTNYQRLLAAIQPVVGPPVASAATIRPRGNIVHVTGTTGITAIDFIGYTIIVLIFDGIVVVTDGGHLKLAGSFTSSAADTLTLAWDGADWFELHRSVN